MTTFRDLGLRAEIVDALAAQGIDEPFPIQAATIADALAQRDVCGKAKTGSGKTLAFGLPLLQTVAPARPGHPTALVLVPTRELAKQVVDVLAPIGKEVGARVAAFYGGTSMEKQIRSLRRHIEVAVATPGRLIDLLERNELDLDAVTILVVDEADRMADMGFLPQVEWLLRKVPDDRQTLLFSATLDREVDVLVRRYMRDPVRHEVVSQTQTVEEMTHRFLKVHELDRVKVLAAIAGGVARTMVFVRTKRGADKLVSQLKREGVHAAAIHGDLRQTAREKALKDFAQGNHGLLIATDVAARGIHVDDVDVVVHYDPPEEHKSYVHRSGRTARAGNAGIVVTFVLWNQELEVERLQKRLGLREPIIEVFSNDPRLADLEALDSPAPR
ncbi:MAG TPA: DEAD/DEAH box helicase, partial [Acidimicrobiia bacterium]|nr:DEAD/DEAH box helicase [Acidimicrobiia bacterium]